MPGSDGDCGVAADGPLVCQNFEAHDEEVRMVLGPYLGVMCPECGRFAGGPDRSIPYDDGEEGAWAAAVALERLEDDLRSRIEEWRTLAEKQRAVGNDEAASVNLKRARQIEELLQNVR